MTAVHQVVTVETGEWNLVLKLHDVLYWYVIF